MWRIRSWVIFLLAAAVLDAAPVAAQPTSMADIAAEQRKARSQESRPSSVGKAEAAFLWLSDERLMDRLFDPRKGWFVRVGLPTAGAALGAGPAWRYSNLSRSYSFTASSAFSISREWLGELSLQAQDLLPERAPDRLFAGLSVSRSGRVENEFWGLGPATVDTDRTVFRITQTAASGTVGIRVQPWLNVAGSAAWLTPRVRESRRTGLPLITERFDETTTPGLVEQPPFLKTEVALDVDYRDTIPSTRTAVRLDQLPLTAASRGGRYQVIWAAYHDRELDRYSFRQITVDLQQHVSILEGERGIALRALTVMSDADDDQAVPFYLSPTLGGLTIGRAFPTFRFRDRNLLVLQAEYRYRINPLMSGAVFFDTGQVATYVRQFALRDFEPSYGLGIRLGAKGAAALRLDVVVGSNFRIILAGGHAF